ncbi:MAG: NAD(P)H-hydrate dehydratase [Candidatus Aenigmatarchaeota archaeon]
MDYVTNEILKKVYPKKDEWSHKGDYGRLLVVAGSKWMTGAPVLIGLAALRGGCDVIYFIGPERSMEVVAKTYPSFISHPLKGDFLEEKHIEEILDFAFEMRITGLAIGPGLYRKDKTKKAIVKIVQNLDCPMVIDADAIRAISIAKNILKNKNVVLTPHENEFYELTGVHLDTYLEKRANKVKEETYKLNCDEKGICPLVPNVVMVVKGHVDIISNGREVVLNKKQFGVYATKGGFGDTLTGICAAFLSRRKNKLDLFTAAQAATFINGKAIDLAYKKYGKGIGPLDLIETIPLVISSK